MEHWWDILEVRGTFGKGIQSPLDLFLIAVEFFSMLFIDNIKCMGFEFHPKCRELNLSMLPLLMTYFLFLLQLTNRLWS